MLTWLYDVLVSMAGTSKVSSRQRWEEDECAVRPQCWQRDTCDAEQGTGTLALDGGVRERVGEDEGEPALVIDPWVSGLKRYQRGGEV